MVADGPVDTLVLVTNDSEIQQARARDIGVVSDDQILAQAAAEEAMIAATLETIDEALASGSAVLWYTPLNNFFRRAASDDQIGDQPVQRGDRVILLYPSANRDESVFADPFSFDIRRNRTRTWPSVSARICASAPTSLGRRSPPCPVISVLW